MEWAEFLQNAAALVVAAILGGFMGLEREAHGRWAGLRTHMLVAAGTCLFMLVGAEAGQGREQAAVLSRVMQGIAAGIGFIGAGTILKLTDKMEVRGLTTASSIWMAAAIGTACGIHRYALAVSATVLALAILVGLRLAERQLSPRKPKSSQGQSEDSSNQSGER